ncbi:MAG TPA: NAD-glutamate dehydrogenase domain-containing protein [Vicinamibacteria bacterium]|nr:NAD-glutamate dehydrogenase domain-containing protein [Vicinamibacteria bacterium]
MITADAGRRAARLEEVLQVLDSRAPAEDRALLRAFAAVVFTEMPDALALALPADALAARLLDHFRFFAREFPPAQQLYRGLPGIHVVVRNPRDAEDQRVIAGRPVPIEATIVETHTVDAPFIFESLKNYFRRAGLRVFTAIHPILTVRRQWERIVFIGGPGEEGSRESFCHFRIERIDSKERLAHVAHEIYSVLKSVLTAVDDFEDMRRTVREAGAQLRERTPGAGRVEAAKAFIDWLLDDNYIFMGVARYAAGPDGRLDRLAETSTGVFTDPSLLPVVFPGLVEEVEKEMAAPPDDTRVIDIDYCNNASALHHLEPIDDVEIRHWSEDGSLSAVTLVLGRFATGAFTEKSSDIPLLREKHDWILAHSGAAPQSHAYREIRALFNRFPKRELFYASAPALKDIFDRIAYMTGDEDIAVHSRRGAGYVALAVAFSRLRYSARLEEELRRILTGEFGPVAYLSSHDCGSVILILCYFDAEKMERPVDEEEVRRLVEPLLVTWEDRVAAVLEASFGEREGRHLLQRYIRSESRSGLYRESTPPEEVPADIRRLEALEGRLEVGVFPRSAESVTLKLFSDGELPLTETLRTLQNLGLEVAEEMRMPLVLPEGRKAFLHRYEVEGRPERIGSLVTGEARFVEALQALDEERATDDALNALVLDAELGWREIEVLRTLRNHLLQVRTHYNVDTVNGVLTRNTAVAGALYRLFAARFDPGVADAEREAAVAEADKAVRKSLEAVRSLAEDEVLRGLDNLVKAVLRTNAYQHPPRPVVSIKVDSHKVEGMPSPRPMFEIYVHSRRLQGIHLRGGKVARGGIRWSDRHDDFRTEVLGLMKTQMVKNSIIVPVGSKGGFVLKGSVPARPALDDYLVARYREFVSGLLDVTDNIVDGKVTHPPEVVRHDGDDPYLVVAADKGTAHLSDTANSVSSQYGFWLGDAFASGGSVGYDHKKVGITARGAWECVKHHFRNLGHDVQARPFTCVGIGDMSGDVFGNGMLQSRATKLLAAFNHLHIFVDPDPDPERSFVERERMFRLPRSSWRDYDASLVSKGGGVFDRGAKAIPVSPEMRRALGLEGAGDAVSGEELVRRILSAPVDLLYNGGIGTYVKASTETHAQVGDRTNDRVRVEGKDVRARVVAEGGNLGLTQRGRLEYAGRGGLINTDAIDNSGGVDMSDHEVNIKILLDILVKRGVIASRAERDRILMEMTEEVAGLVLADNENQARALTLDQARSAARYEDFVALIEDMVGAGVLNRADEAIPTRDELLASPQRERGLPRPLLAVLLGHTKMFAFEMAMETPFPDGPSGRPFLEAYFPRRIRESFAQHLDQHTLRREIIATAAVNHVVNNAGITFLSRLMALGRGGPGEILAAYLDAERSSGAHELRDRIQARALPAEQEHRALLDLERGLETLTVAALEGRAGDAAAALKPVRELVRG